jgi:hypothetical protein
MKAFPSVERRRTRRKESMRRCGLWNEMGEMGPKKEGMRCPMNSTIRVM